MEIALVGCSKLKWKTNSTAPASRLYVGRLFKLAYRHAVNTADDVHIISALHGLVEPHQHLAPYDYSMVSMRADERREWGKRVVGQLLTHYPLRYLHISIYAGSTYVNPILLAIEEDGVPWECEIPLQGMDLFERFQWFRENSPECSSAC